MYQAPDVMPLGAEPFASTISLPYRLTPGHATGHFLAGMRERRIVGTRCPACGRVEVPAQDVCLCGHDTLELVELSGQGTLQGHTRMPGQTLALVRLDGTSCDWLHRLVGEPSGGEWAIGQRVAPRWAAATKGHVLDLEGFAAATGAAAAEGSLKAVYPGSLGAPVDSYPTSLTLNYQHARGPYYGRLFDEMQGAGRIVGIRCPRCHSVLLPPRELCDVCYVRTGTWADVAHTGVLQAFSIIHLKFVGQFREPPYIYAEIMLDGANTKMIHTLEGVDIETAPRKLKPGMRVKAVWKPELKGSLDDISHFELIDPLPAD